MEQAWVVFLTVADKKNFTRAAEELHMTQPAVSQTIQMLERELGTQLLERSNKHVRLNQAGEIVYHHAKEIVGLHVRMRSLVDDLLHKASGPLAIGASYTFGEYVLPHVMAKLRDRFPMVQPSITIGNSKQISEKVAATELDIGIVEGEFPHERLRIEPLAEDRMSIMASAGHRLADKADLDPGELAEDMWIVRETGSGTRAATEAMFASLGLKPRDYMEFGSTQLIKESVEAGLGITLLSRWAVRKETVLGTMKPLRVKGMPITRRFYVVKPAARFHTRAAELFGSLVLERDFPGIDDA